jgi:hypothetical protein
METLDNQNVNLRLKTEQDIGDFINEFQKKTKARESLMGTDFNWQAYQTLFNTLRAPLPNSPTVWNSQVPLPFAPKQSSTAPTHYVSIRPHSLLKQSNSFDSITLIQKNKKHCKLCGEHRVAATGHHRNKPCPNKSKKK